MSSRVVGRGVCPKCGREGSVVFKEISGRIYVYMKHGRDWCYLGPLGSVDLSSVLTDLTDYHTFTTKLAGFIRSRWGSDRMKVSTPFTIGLALLLTAYGVGLGGPNYGNYVLALVLLSTLSFLLAIATYESIYSKLKSYMGLSRVMSKGLMPYTLLTAALVFFTVIITIPLEAPIKLELTYHPPPYVGIESVRTAIPITSVIITSLVVTYLSRPLINSLRSYLTYIVLSTLVGYAALLTLPLIQFGINVLAEPSTLTYLAVSVGTALVITAALITIFTVSLSVLKRVVKM